LNFFSFSASLPEERDSANSKIYMALFLPCMDLKVTKAASKE
jgi:hypothetical protein